MHEPGPKTQRFDIPYFDGVNGAVQTTLAKKVELSHAENARAPQVGVIEKREGQTKKGTGNAIQPFQTTGNYGLAKFKTSKANSQGVYRVSDTATIGGTLSISVYDYITVIDVQAVGDADADVYLFAADTVTVSEPSFFLRSDAPSGHTTAWTIDGTTNAASIYDLTEVDHWSVLTDSTAGNIGGVYAGSDVSFTSTDVGLVMANYKDHNRLIGNNGSTVTSSIEAGNLYNSPRASKAAFYKGRIYLADYYRSGERYKTSVVRSSYPLGIIALVDGDQSISSGGDLSVTDNKYFYADSGMNTYDVYRGGSKITTITVTAVNEASVTCTFSGSPTFNSADEIWISGTYAGAKQYRWVNNPTSIGRDVKQYDTFKLSGGDEDPITLMTPIGNVLMIGNNNSLMTWNDYTLQGFDLGIGCVAKNGYTKLLGTLYFLHYSGIYGTTGAMPRLLSRKVDRYIKGATREGLENAAAGFKELSVFFSIGDVTLYDDDGSTWEELSDVCLEYSVADENWYVHTNVPAEHFLQFIDMAGTERLLMTHNGQDHYVKEFLNGNTDDGDEIFFRIDTNEIQLMKEFENVSNPISISTQVRRGSLLKGFVKLDRKPFYQMKGDIRKGVSILKVSAKTEEEQAAVLCHTIKISLRDSSQQRCRIHQMAINYLPGTATLEDDKG